jgi:hypothetical protein
MKKLFSELYCRVCAEPKHEQLEKRWQGIEEYCAQDEFDISNLVKMAFSLKPSEEFRQHFVSVFQNIDMSFQLSFTKEQELLSCICLIKLMKDSSLHIHIALAVMCISKYNIEVLVPELITEAYQVFGTNSAIIREKSISYKSYLTTKSTNFAKSIKELTTLDSENIKGISDTVSEIVKNFTIIVHNQNQTLEAIDILREDSDILSWLTGSWSNELGKAITKKTMQSEVALLLAKELSDLVRVVPGPYAFEAFLKKMLDNCKQDVKTYSLVTMVDLINNKFKSSILESYPTEEAPQENTPILFSIKCALDANVPDVWKSIATNKLSINVEIVENTALEWAKLMYFECLLVKLKGCE